MTLIIKDRVVETSTSTGTGNFTLSGALAGYRAFSSVCSTNDICYYMIEAIDASGVPTGDWETGLGTYSAANTLTRTTVIASSNSNAAVSFAAGTKRVSISAISSMMDGWHELDYYDIGASGAVNHRDADVSAFNEVMVIFDRVTSGSSILRAVQVSDNGGSSFYNTSGNYLEVQQGGITVNDAGFWAQGTTAASAARSGSVHITQLKSLRSPKVAYIPAYSAAAMFFFIGSSSPINMVRACGIVAPNTLTNMTGGTIQILGRI